MGQRKQFYKNQVTGCYGIGSSVILSAGNQRFRLFTRVSFINGLMELNNYEEKVLESDLVEASEQEVHNSLIGF